MYRYNETVIESIVRDVAGQRFTPFSSTTYILSKLHYSVASTIHGSQKTTLHCPISLHSLHTNARENYIESMTFFLLIHIHYIQI